MPILSGQSLILPATAGLEAAFAEPLVLPDPAPGQPSEHVCPGGYYEIIVSAQAVVTSNAAAATRSVSIVYWDANNRVIVFLPPLVAQGPSSSLNYQWLLGFSNEIGGGAQNALGPLAAVVLLPGYKFWVYNNGGAPGDQVSGVVLYTQRFPTGPRFADAPGALSVTPSVV